MSQRLNDKKEMPDIPKIDFEDALAEIWSQINFAAYHMACVQVYAQSVALRVRAEALREEEQSVRDHAQVDVIICRTHLAAFFWHLEHVFESLRIAITRGKTQYPGAKYFWAYETRMDEIEKRTIRQEIKDYRKWVTRSPRLLALNGMSEGASFIISSRPSADTSPKKTST